MGTARPAAPRAGLAGATGRGNARRRRKPASAGADSKAEGKASGGEAGGNHPKEKGGEGKVVTPAVRRRRKIAAAFHQHPPEADPRSPAASNNPWTPSSNTPSPPFGWHTSGR